MTDYICPVCKDTTPHRPGDAHCAAQVEALRERLVHCESTLQRISGCNWGFGGYVFSEDAKNWMNPRATQEEEK